jgi:hypothetical protein
VRPLLAALLLPALLLSNASAADSKSTAPSLCLQSFTFFSCCCVLLPAATLVLVLARRVV